LADLSTLAVLTAEDSPVLLLNYVGVD